MRAAGDFTICEPITLPADPPSPWCCASNPCHGLLCSHLLPLTSRVTLGGDGHVTTSKRSHSFPSFRERCQAFRIGDKEVSAWGSCPQETHEFRKQGNNRMYVTNGYCLFNAQDVRGTVVFPSDLISSSQQPCECRNFFPYFRDEKVARRIGE